MGLAVALSLSLFAHLACWTTNKERERDFLERKKAQDQVVEAVQKRVEEIQKEHAAALKAAKQEPTYDCRELLHDLTEGAGLVKITRISPLDIYIKRS